MEVLLESVPNVSEGRDARTIASLRALLAEHAVLVDVHVDPDHNRSVFTLFGDSEQLQHALLVGIAHARDRIDLRRHDGAHPCVGAVDVVPIVPMRPEQMEDAVGTAVRVADRVGSELGLPVFLYGAAGDGRRPAFFRRGGIVELGRRVDGGELTPDFGPKRLDPAFGAVLVGARPPLIAFNVNLSSEDVAVAHEIAALVREAGGGFSGVRALGIALPSRGLVQVSMNIEDWRAAPLHEVVAAIEREAAARGVAVAGSELVGLMPAGAAAVAAGGPLRLHGLDASRILEVRMEGARADAGGAVESS
jgi:glutamate formiminotransferase/glutamate formiminotransferase/formiminotetrahydrofolate cyclodeaminase